MEAVHIRTKGFYCGACPKVIEKAVGSLDGVADVVAVRSMGLTSVLYDPEIVSREVLCERIRKAGFGAEVYCPSAAPGSACADGGTSPLLNEASLE